MQTLNADMKTRFLQKVLADALAQLANGCYGAKRIAAETVVDSTRRELAAMGMPESPRRL